jgi:hypothetical protein
VSQNPEKLHSMPKPTSLDQQWRRLMMLCGDESKLRSEGNHPRLLKLINSDIEELALQMGFSPRRVATRDFRAERDGPHITRIIPD